MYRAKPFLDTERILVSVVLLLYTLISKYANLNFARSSTY